MYKLRVQIYIKKVQICARQKSYGFKILAKLGRWEKLFEITAGKCISKKSCSNYKTVPVFLQNLFKVAQNQSKAKTQSKVKQESKLSKQTEQTKQVK